MPRYIRFVPGFPMTVTGKIQKFRIRDEVNYPEMAAKLGTTEGALKVAMHRLRHRFGEQLREEVAKTVAEPGEIEAEIRYLLAAFEA